MPYPIRFKLIDRETGEVLKGPKKEVTLNTDGQPVVIQHPQDWDCYLGATRMHCADYELHVALNKDAKGDWIYQKVGY